MHTKNLTRKRWHQFCLRQEKTLSLRHEGNAGSNVFFYARWAKKGVSVVGAFRAIHLTPRRVKASENIKKVQRSCGACHLEHQLREPLLQLRERPYLLGSLRVLNADYLPPRRKVLPFVWPDVTLVQQHQDAVRVRRVLGAQPFDLRPTFEPGPVT